MDLEAHRHIAYVRSVREIWNLSRESHLDHHYALACTNVPASASLPVERGKQVAPNIEAFLPTRVIILRTTLPAIE
jgi:hypothetical protein